MMVPTLLTRLCHHPLFSLVVPASVFVDVEEMDRGKVAIRTPRSFCIMRQTWENFVSFLSTIWDFVLSYMYIYMYSGNAVISIDA